MLVGPTPTANGVNEPASQLYVRGSLFASEDEEPSNTTTVFEPFPEITNKLVFPGNENGCLSVALATGGVLVFGGGPEVPLLEICIPEIIAYPPPPGVTVKET